MRKILYLSYDGMTDPLGQSQVIPYLSGLSCKGYQITLISFEKKKKFKKDKALISTLLEGDDIQWEPLTYHKSPPVLSTLYDLFCLWKKVGQLLSVNDFHIIHCRSYLTTLIGLYFKKKYRVKLVFDMRGFWADERVEGGIWNIQNPAFKYIYQYFKRKERIFWKASDYIISLTHQAKEYIESTEENCSPIEVIPCCADLSLFSPVNVQAEKSNHLRSRLGLIRDDFILLYLGSLGTWYMLEEMLDFFLILLEYKPQSKFLFLTKDDPEPIMAMAISKGILKNQIIISASERKILPCYLKLAQLAIFFIKPVFSKKASSPTKQGEIMGMGIPIVCNEGVGDTAEIIQESGAGAVIADFTEANYREVCQHLDSLLLIKPETVRAGAQHYYSLEKGVETYHQVYEQLF